MLLFFEIKSLRVLLFLLEWLGRRDLLFTGAAHFIENKHGAPASLEPPLRKNLPEHDVKTENLSQQTAKNRISNRVFVHLNPASFGPLQLCKPMNSFF